MAINARKYIPNDSQFSEKSFLIALAVVVAILLLLFVFRPFTIVGTGEIGVMTRFGQVTGQELGEGFHLKNPLDKPNIYDIKVLKDETEAASASKDLQDVNATVVTNYQVEAGRVSELHQTVGIDYKIKLIDPAVQEVFKAATAKFDATELITNREAAKANAYELLRDRLKTYGIIVRDLSIADFSFSNDFSKAIEDAQVAKQNVERAKNNLEAARIDAQAQEVQAKTLSPLYLQKQFLEKWNGELPQYYGGDSIFNIPLR
jgi:regulator of protease activity HflC (stomatin/prohibitin superfamily)